MSLLGSKRERLAASLTVLGVAVGLYANTLTGEFVFDDHAAIEVNADVRSNTPLWVVFSNDFWGTPLTDPESHKSYRPLTTLTFRLNHLVHGLWPPGFHALNVAAHALVCLLYFWSCLGFGLQLAPSLIAALLFAAHPIHTEAVANVVGRSEMLAAVLFLLALISYQKAIKEHGSLTVLWVLLTIALSVTSLLCKEQGITVLGLCTVSDLLSAIDATGQPSKARGVPHKHKQTSKQINTSPSRWTNYTLGRVAFLLPALLIILLIRIYLIGGGTPTFVDSDNPASFSPHFLTRLLTYCYLCAVNAWLLLCPSQLCHDWSMGSIPLVQSLWDPRNLATLFVAFALLILVFGAFYELCKLRGREKTQYCHYLNGHSALNGNGIHCNGYTRKTTIANTPRSSRDRLIHNSCLIPLGLSWTITPFIPASNLFFPVGFVVAERVLYLPSMGYCLLLSLGISSFWTKRKKLCTLLLSILLLLFSAKTVLRNAEWQTTWTIAQSAMKVNPGNAKIQMNVANTLAQQGDRRCEVFYREAVRLRPQYASAWANLGLVLINTDRPQEAEEAYLRALSFKPNHINGNTNMGHLCRLQGRWQEARTYFSVALQRRPHSPTLHYYVGVVTEALGMPEDQQIAEREYELATQYNPSYWEAHYHLAHLLTKSGRPQKHTHDRARLQKALLHYKMAARLNGDDTAIQYELGRLLLSLDQAKEAETHLLRAVHLTPTHGPAHSELANVYTQLGLPQRAREQLQKAADLDKPSPTITPKR